MNKHKLRIEGMSCGACANRVLKALKEVPGVTDAAVSLEAGTAEVFAEGPLDLATLLAAVEKKGYHAGAAP